MCYTHHRRRERKENKEKNVASKEHESNKTSLRADSPYIRSALPRMLRQTGVSDIGLGGNYCKTNSMSVTNVAKSIKRIINVK